MRTLLTDMTACNTVIFKQTAERVSARYSKNFMRDNIEAVIQAEKMFKAKGFKADILCIKKENPNEPIIIEFDTGAKAAFEKYSVIIIGRHIIDIYGGSIRPMLAQDYLYRIDKVNNRLKCVVSKEDTTHYIVDDPTVKDPYHYIRFGKLGM